MKRRRTYKIDSIDINFYKFNLQFPLSGGDSCYFHHPPSIRRVFRLLHPLLNKKTNVKLNLTQKNKIFISHFIRFCELEGIDYHQILEFEVSVKVVHRDITFDIIVNYGSHDDVLLIEI